MNWREIGTLFITLPEVTLVLPKTLRIAILAIAAASYLIAFSFAQSGSSGPTDTSITSAPKETIRVEITTGIDEYSPFMSVCPAGMPLNAIVKGSKDTTKLKYRWQAQDGSLSLQQAPKFKIVTKGKIALTSSSTVGWRPVFIQPPQNPYTAKICLEALDEEKNVIGKAEINLNIDQNLKVTAKK
jgi:hypothetical protein